MSEDLRNPIFESFSLKETDELVAIWQANDRGEWSDLAFEVLHDILQERLGELPAQAEPVYEEDEEDFSDEVIDEVAWDEMIEEDEEGEGPVLYRPLQVHRLVTWLNRAATASIILVSLSTLIYLIENFNNGSALTLFFRTLQASYLPSALTTVLMGLINGVIQVCVVYLPLKALAAILKILAEMEHHSRQAGSGDSSSSEPVIEPA